MKVMNVRLIAFDIDGTLAETDDYYVEKSAVLLRKVFPFISPSRMEKIVRKPVMLGETILHGFYRLLDMVGLDKVISKAHSKISVKKEYNYREVEGMRETLALLSQKYIIGIITSGGYISTQAFLNKFDLNRFVSHVISAENCRFIKPHPMPMRKMAELADVPVENCILVGDTIFDILCAKRAGAYSAAVKTGFDSEILLKKFNADLLLDSVNDLPDILAKECSADYNKKAVSGD